MKYIADVGSSVCRGLGWEAEGSRFKPLGGRNMEGFLVAG